MAPKCSHASDPSCVRYRRVCPELRRAEIYAIAQKYMRWHIDRSLPRARPVAFVMSHEWLWLL